MFTYCLVIAGNSRSLEHHTTIVVEGNLPGVGQVSNISLFNWHIEITEIKGEVDKAKPGNRGIKRYIGAQVELLTEKIKQLIETPRNTYHFAPIWTHHSFDTSNVELKVAQLISLSVEFSVDSLKRVLIRNSVKSTIPSQNLGKVRNIGRSVHLRQDCDVFSGGFVVYDSGDGVSSIGGNVSIEGICNSQYILCNWGL